MIPEEAVQIAADYLPHDRDCESRPERDCQCRHLRLATMQAALTAAAPFIRAQALEDAASELESDAGYSSHFEPEEITQGKLIAAEFLRARAVTERGGE